MNVLAKAAAVKLLKDLFIDLPEKLDLGAIAGMENLFIEERELAGKEGSLVLKDGIGIISVDSKITEPGQKRFTVAHELGHYYNEVVPAVRKGKSKFIFSCTGEDIRSINYKNDNEIMANDFAAELLMPEEWFREFTRGRKFGTALLSDSASYFNTSLSAAALRYAEIGSHPVAVIMSKNMAVRWVRFSSYFPFKFIRIGSKISSLSFAYEFYQKNPLPDQPEMVLADAWFLEDFNYKKDYFLFEQNIPMYRYNAVLTILWEA